ncbi:MAG: hypothetical protein FWG34_08445, partial [Oscillospiraceae bacterium]|nr:hypothetical protein [Oscillospiraceae bacterium]
AIKSDGSLWAWGDNSVGQLGDGTVTTYDYDDYLNVIGFENNNKLTPTHIMDNVAQVSAGAGYTMVIKSDGSLWAWGENGFGRIGDGTTTDGYEPVHIMDNVAQVSAGEYHTMAIKTDGSLWALGNNDYGQIGDGTASIFNPTMGITIKYDYKSTPVHIMDNVAQVSAGEYHTMAIKTDGSLWAWGNNDYGQIGDGTTTDRYERVLIMEPVYIMDNVAQISAGEMYTMAIKSDGSLWAWGYNGNGQIGDGTTTDRHSPVKIMDNVAQVSAGAGYTIAVKSDGGVWTWGRNYLHQLGSDTPVKIMDGGATERATSQLSSQPPQTETPSQLPKTPRIGEQIGDVVYTSITAYIDGQPIPISNINGYAQIIVEDLAGYGFDMAWNAAEKTLRVERNRGKATKPLPIESIPPGKKPGDLKAKYVVSAIKVYLSGELVESYSINGYMFIDFNLLGKYGKVTWDNSARRLSCQLY